VIQFVDAFIKDNVAGDGGRSLVAPLRDAARILPRMVQRDAI
jgi:hypothetical protein